MAAENLARGRAPRRLPAVLLGAALAVAAAPATPALPPAALPASRPERAPSPVPLKAPEATVPVARAPAAAPAPQGDEVVYGDFDLAGWLRLGHLHLEGSQLDRGNLAALVDESPGTLVRAAGVNPATFSLEFDTPRVVRRVTLTPGSSDPYAVGLTVVEEGGRRFAAGETVVSDDNSAIFRLLDVPTRRLELKVERLERDDVVHVAGIRVTGEMHISALSLEQVPETLPEGGSFPIVVVGRDAWGGTPDLTTVAQLAVTPERALALAGPRRAVTRVGGPISIVPHVGALSGPARSLLVIPLAARPPAPGLTAGFAVVRLQLDGEPPFEVLRRATGEKESAPLGRCLGQRYWDDAVVPGVAYQYSYRRIDRLGNPLTPASEETRTRTLARPADGQIDPGRLPVLVALYVDSLQAEGERAAIEESLRAASGFVWRHTRGQLVLDLTVLPLSGPTPDTAGGSMVGIEADLRAQGVTDDMFGMVFAVADDLAGSWGNVSLLGRTGGALGRSADVPTPPGALGPDPGLAFVFVHELLHVLGERVALSVGRGDVPSGHFSQDFAEGRLGAAAGRPADLDEGWAGQAQLLAGIDFWPEVGAPYRRALETIDTDGDGVPDDDPALPLDERRLGSDPTRPDSDDDGLDDLAEAAAGIYGPTDPRTPDTDGDGQPDGSDPWPLSDFTGLIPRGTEPRPLASGPQFEHPAVRLLAAWDETALRLAVITPMPADVYVDLDGSGSLGRWESDVDTGSAEAPAGDVWAGPARLVLRAHEPPTGVFVGDRPVPGATLDVQPVPGGERLLAILPRALGPGATDVFVPPGAPRVDGLRLRPGTVLGLAVTVRPARPDQTDPLAAFPVDQPWIGLFETGRLLDAVLAD